MKIIYLHTTLELIVNNVQASKLWLEMVTSQIASGHNCDYQSITLKIVSKLQWYILKKNYPTFTASCFHIILMVHNTS